MITFQKTDARHADIYTLQQYATHCDNTNAIIRTATYCTYTRYCRYTLRYASWTQCETCWHRHNAILRLQSSRELQCTATYCTQKILQPHTARCLVLWNMLKSTHRNDKRMQHTAHYCDLLQPTAITQNGALTYCNIRQPSATYCSLLQPHRYWNIVQPTATYCNLLQFYNLLQLHQMVRYIVQCIAIYFNVLQPHVIP